MNHLFSIPWEEELCSLDTKDDCQHFNGKIKASLDLFISKVPQCNANRPQRMTWTVKRLIRTKQRHYNTYMTSRTEIHREQFKRTEKLCKKAVHSAKRKFESNIAKNGNKRPFNAYIKSKTKSRDNVGLLKVGDNDNEQMATLLNASFSSVFSNEKLSDILQCQYLSGNQSPISGSRQKKLPKKSRNLK